MHTCSCSHSPSVSVSVYLCLSVSLSLSLSPKQKQRTRNKLGCCEPAHGFWELNLHPLKREGALKEWAIYWAPWNSFLFLWRKGFIWLTLPRHCWSSKKVRTGTQEGLEPGGRSWYRGHGIFATRGLLRVLSPRTQDHQSRDGSTHNVMGPSPSLTK